MRYDWILTGLYGMIQDNREMIINWGASATSCNYNEMKHPWYMYVYVHTKVYGVVYDVKWSLAMVGSWNGLLFELMH